MVRACLSIFSTASRPSPLRYSTLLRYCGENSRWLVMRSFMDDPTCLPISRCDPPHFYYRVAFRRHVENAFAGDGWRSLTPLWQKSYAGRGC